MFQWQSTLLLHLFMYAAIEDSSERVKGPEKCRKIMKKSRFCVWTAHIYLIQPLLVCEEQLCKGKQNIIFKQKNFNLIDNYWLFKPFCTDKNTFFSFKQQFLLQTDIKIVTPVQRCPLQSIAFLKLYSYFWKKIFLLMRKKLLSQLCISWTKYWTTLSVAPSLKINANITVYIQCRKTTVLSCHRWNIALWKM